MAEGGRRPAKRFVEKQMFRRGRLPLVTPKNVTDVHQMIVDHIGQMIRRKPVGLEKNEIALVGVGIVFVMTVDEIFVLLHAVFVSRQRETNDVRKTLLNVFI